MAKQQLDGRHFANSFVYYPFKRLNEKINMSHLKPNIGEGEGGCQYRTLKYSVQHYWSPLFHKYTLLQPRNHQSNHPFIHHPHFLLSILSLIHLSTLSIIHSLIHWYLKHILKLICFNKRTQCDVLVYKYTTLLQNVSYVQATY